jgi:hypothetical protein
VGLRAAALTIEQTFMVRSLRSRRFTFFLTVKQSLK